MADFDFSRTNVRTNVVRRRRRLDFSPAMRARSIGSQSRQGIGHLTGQPVGTFHRPAAPSPIAPTVPTPSTLPILRSPGWADNWARWQGHNQARQERGRGARAVSEITREGANALGALGALGGSAGGATAGFGDTLRALAAIERDTMEAKFASDFAQRYAIESGEAATADPLTGIRRGGKAVSRQALGGFRLNS